MTEAVTIRLLLDNGGAIEGTKGSAVPQYLSFRKRIELGQLTEEEQAEQLRKIADVYHRLAENAKPDTKRGPSPLVEEPAGQSLATCTVTRASRSHLLPDAHEKPTPLRSQVRTGPQTASMSKVAKTSSLSKHADIHQRSNQGRKKTNQKKTLKQLVDIVSKTDTLHLFRRPVTEDIAPKYHDIVHNPMDFQTIRLKLDKDQYEDEARFKQDMDLIFSNCELYNGTQSEVAKHGMLVKKAWENAWEQREMCSADTSQARKGSKRLLERASAQSDQGGGNYESCSVPNLKDAQPSSIHPPAQQSDEGQLLLVPKARRTISQNNTAAQAKQLPVKFPAARVQELTTFLGACEETVQENVINFLNECNCDLPVDEDGDSVLDLTALEDKVLWSLDEYLRKTCQGQYNP